MASVDRVTVAAVGGKGRRKLAVERGHWEPRTLPPPPGGVVLGEMPGILQKTALPLLPKVPIRERNLQEVKRLEEARENVHLLKRPERLLN